ncbi:MAG: glycosyltransferase family 4 protein [Nitrososphaeria archaeon]
MKTPKDKNLLIFSIANPDFVTKFKRKDLLSQDLNGFFKKVHYVFLLDKPFKPYTEKIDATYSALYLSNKRFARFQRGQLRHLNTAISLVYNFLYLWRYVIHNNISVLFSQEPFVRGSLAYAISNVTGRPYVVEVCSNFKNKHWEEGRLEVSILKTIDREKKLLRFILLHANAVIADRDNYWNDGIIPHELGNRYFRYHFSMEEAHYSPPENRLNLKQTYNALNKKVVLYIGRLVKEKRSEDLSLVAKELFLRNDLPDTIMWIVGDGPLKSHLIEEIKKYGLSDKVLFIDSQTTAMVANFLSTADVVIAPHAGWVIPECQLAETPIVVYDFEWHREGVADGKYGIIVPYRDARAMANAAKDVLLHPDKYKPMMKAARQWVLQNNTLEREIADKLKIYRAVLGE